MNTYANKDQMVELGTSLLKTLVGIEDAPRERVQELIENPAELKDIARKIVVGEVVPVSTDSTSRQLAEWKKLYTTLGITLNVADVKIPKHKKGFDRLIVIPKGMTAQKAYDLCAKQFNGRVWKYTDESLDKVVPTNDRNADSGTYAIWVRDRDEADEELKNKSADDLKAEGIKGITLTERLLYGLKYFSETKKHLDVENWTLCSGSHDADGDVPSVGWSGYCDWLSVNWSDASYRGFYLRSRAVVSL